MVREKKSPVRAQKHGTASESEERDGFALPRPTLQGLEVGTGSVSVCRAQDRAVWRSKTDEMIKWKEQKRWLIRSVIDFE